MGKTFKRNENKKIKAHGKQFFKKDKKYKNSHSESKYKNHDWNFEIENTYE